MKEWVMDNCPTLCRVLEGTSLLKDLAQATSILAEGGERRIWDAARGGQLSMNRLMLMLVEEMNAANSGADSNDITLEEDLRTLVDAVGIDEVRSAFRAKLVADAQWIDVNHEIAVAAAAVSILDAGTLRLEAEIKGSGRNSDVTGMYQGAKVRIEVTVLHEEWPPRMPEEVQTKLENIDIPCGYAVLLRDPVQFVEEAERVIEVVRQIYDRRSQIDEWGEQVGLMYVTREGDSTFGCDAGLVDTIEFVEEDMKCRLVSNPAFSRPMMDPNEWSQMQDLNPPEVKTLGDADVERDRKTHKNMPTSTKIIDVIRRKKNKQCEEGAINVVAIGVFMPIGERDIADALYGPEFATLSRSEEGTRAEGLYRKPSGPFVPENQSENREMIVEPYRILSAVAGVRCDRSHPMAKVWCNPNATIGLPSEMATALEEEVGERSGRYMLKP